MGTSCRKAAGTKCMYDAGLIRVAIATKKKTYASPIRSKNAGTFSIFHHIIFIIPYIPRKSESKTEFIF
jgi:hypothetical protein